MSDGQATQNTDVRLFTDAAGNEVFATQGHAGLGINVGGLVFVKPLATWHALARMHAADFAAIPPVKAQGEATGAVSEPIAWQYENSYGDRFLTHKDPAKWHPHDRAGFQNFKPLYALPPVAGAAGTVPKLLHGFDRSDLEAIADGLEAGYEKTVNVGQAIEPGFDVHVESTTGAAARFIRTALATLPPTPPAAGTVPIEAGGGVGVAPACMGQARFCQQHPACADRCALGVPVSPSGGVWVEWEHRCSRKGGEAVLTTKDLRCKLCGLAEADKDDATVAAVTPTQQRKATDAEIQEWADRHDLGRSSITELRCIFEDAESLHLTRGVKTTEAPSQCEYCFDLGWEWEEGDDNSWKVPCPRNCAAAVKWLADASGVMGKGHEVSAAQTPTGKDQ